VTGVFAGLLIGTLLAFARAVRKLTRENARLRAAGITVITEGAEDYRMLLYGMCAELGLDECRRIETTGRTGPWASPASVERFAQLLDERGVGHAWPVSPDV
jgi:hypothetical protein